MSAGMNGREADVHSTVSDKIRDYEIDEARSIQRAMLPVEPLRAPTVEVVCKFRPMAEVGGDFLDFFVMADHRLAIFIGDVVGKGLAAALYGALAVGILRGIKKGGVPPTEVLDFLNRRLLDRAVPGRYCAVQYAVFDPASRELSFANAGLVPRPVHISRNGCRELGGGGLPCGIFKDAQYELNTVQLADGDALLLSTDGLIEAQNPQSEEFGIERVMAVCSQYRDAPPTTLLDHIFDAVDTFVSGTPQHDDMAAALVRLA